jgi:hypothetical protein
MRYKAGDRVWYRGQFGAQEYEGMVRAISTPRPPADEPTYLLTLLSGPFTGQTSVVYERELRPAATAARGSARQDEAGPGAGGLVEFGSSSRQAPGRRS